MLNFVEKSKLLKAIIVVFSLTITIVSFAPIFIELSSTFAVNLKKCNKDECCREHYQYG